MEELERVVAEARALAEKTDAQFVAFVGHDVDCEKGAMSSTSSTSASLATLLAFHDNVSDVIGKQLASAASNPLALLAFRKAAERAFEDFPDLEGDFGNPFLDEDDPDFKSIGD